MKRTIDRLSRELNLPPDVVENTYKAYWMYIKHTIENIQFEEDMNANTFNKLKLNFNIPNLGKLACTYNRYKMIKRKRKNRHAEHKEDKANG